MKAIVDHLRLVVALAALVLIVLGGLGRSMPVHPGMTRDDLAELAVDELVEAVGISEEQARDLIMKARAHWFESESN